MSITYRDLRGMDEFKAAHAMQHVVWGDDDLADPPDLMMVIQDEGGIVAGAFDGDRLLGYVFGFPTRDGHVQHSHRLAVLPEQRGAGIGAGLKTYQRDWCRARGIGIIRWTYDPLLARNANLNIHRLGAIGARYHVNRYGLDGSYNGGVETDRLDAEWHVEGRPATRTEASITIPADFLQRMQSGDPRALEARLEGRHAMQALFDQGLVITGFDLASCRYDFGRIL